MAARAFQIAIMISLWPTGPIWQQIREQYAQCEVEDKATLNFMGEIGGIQNE